MQGIPPLQSAQRETVLVVDDESPVREIVGEMLTSLGYRVLTASDGVEALAIWQDYQGPIDLVLTDVSIPEMDGFVLLEALRRMNPDVRLVFMSGCCSVPGKQVHTSTWLLKPFTLESISQTVRQVLDA